MTKQRWKTLLLILFVVLLISLTACGGSGDEGKTPTVKALSFEEASQVILDQVLKPEGLDHKVIVFGWPEPLTTEDELQPYAADDFTTPGETISIEQDTWFFWIDDAPVALYVHPTRFLLVDVQSGELLTFEEEWWPVLNEESLWVDSEDYWNEDNWIFSNIEDDLISLDFPSPSYKLASPEKVPLVLQEGRPNFALVVNGWSGHEGAKEDLAKNQENMNWTMDRSGFGTTSLGPGDEDIPGKIKDWINDRANEMQMSQTAMIYLTGHGGNQDGLGTIMLGGTRFDEIELSSALQSFHPGVHIIVVIDTCHSGAWSDGLQEVADVNVTSTGADQIAYGDTDWAGDPNPGDSGTEYTSGYQEDWDEITGSAVISSVANLLADENGTNYWEEVAMMSHDSAAAKDNNALIGDTSPTAVRGNPLTTQFIPITSFLDTVYAGTSFSLELMNQLQEDGTGDGTVSDKNWEINDELRGVGINHYMAFWSEFDMQTVNDWHNESYFECGTQVGDVLTICAPDAGPMPEGDELIGMMVLDSDIPLDPGDDIYQYGFVLDSDNDPANNFQFNPPYTYDYFQGTDLWYVVYYHDGWQLGVSTTKSGLADIKSNARAAIIKNILVFFVPADEIPAEFPGYRFSAFGCVEGGWGSGFCNGDVSGIDATYPPIPVSPEKIVIEE